MMSLRAYLDRIEPNFHPGGKYEKFYALYEAVDTIFYAPGTTTKSIAHVRDGIDLKRIMITVWFCTFPAIFFGAFFSGRTRLRQSQLALSLRTDCVGVYRRLAGAEYLEEPIYLVKPRLRVRFLPTNLCNGIRRRWLLGSFFASVRGHEVNEGFFVTSILFSLTCPPDLTALAGCARYHVWCCCW